MKLVVSCDMQEAKVELGENGVCSFNDWVDLFNLQRNKSTEQKKRVVRARGALILTLSLTGSFWLQIPNGGGGERE